MRGQGKQAEKKYQQDVARYINLLDDLVDIPEFRKNVDEQNLLWFLRSGSIINNKHKKTAEAVDIAMSLLNNNN